MRLDLLHIHIRGLHTAAYVIAGLTLGAQLLGLLRDRIFAHQFGAGRELDLFYAAFRVPDLMFALTASLVSVFVLIPYIERAQQRGASEVRGLLSEMFTVFSVMLAGVAGVAAWYAPEWVAYAYGTFAPEEQVVLVSLVRILLLQPLLLGVSNLCAAYVQVRKRFVLYAMAPILYNLGIIVGALFLYPHLGLVGLGWGVLLGAALHLGVQAPFMRSERVFPTLARPNWKRVGDVIRISIPRSLTLSAQQLTLFVLVVLASGFGVGSITAFSLATNLSAVPLALIASSYSVAIFPELARLYGAGNRTELAAVCGTAARAIVFWTLPTTALFFALSEHAVTVLLGTGAFDSSAVMRTATVLSLLVFSLAAQSLSMLLVRTLYATGKTFLPFICTAFGTVFTLCCAYLFTHTPFFVEYLALLNGGRSVDDVRIFGIALAFSLGAYATLLPLVRSVRADVGVLIPTRSLLVPLLASGALFGAAESVAMFVRSFTQGEFTPAAALLQGGCAALVGLAAWVLVLRLFGSEELDTIRRGVQRFFRR